MNKEQLVKIWNTKSDIPKWLEEDFINVSLELAKKHGIHPFIAQFLYEKSFHVKIKKEKVQLLQLAINTANRHDKENLDIYKNQLFELAPEHSPKQTWFESLDKAYKVARGLERTRKFDDARLIYNKIIKAPEIDDELFIKTWNRIRLSYKLERNKDLYIEWTKKMILTLKNHNSPKRKEAYYKTRVNLARAVWTRGDRKRALKILMALSKESFSIPNIKAEALWVIGGIYVEVKKFKKALNYYRQASTQLLDDEVLKTKIYWAIGWNHYLKREYQKSYEYFIDSTKKIVEEKDKDKFKFWAAKSLLKMNKVDIAFEILQEVSKNSFSYYGIMAHKELKVPMAPIHNKYMDIRPPFFNEFAWLVQLGEFSLARSFLDTITVKGNTERLNALPLYAMAKYYSKGIKNFFNLAENTRKEVLSASIQIPYPLPYKEQIDEMTKKRNLPNGLIPSIIRQESAFDRYARSWADAFGLMQIIPEKAKVLAREERLKFNDVQDLYNESYNITLGSKLLSKLKKKYNSFMPFYVAAYNAGETPVNRWKKERYNGKDLEYVEMIPYAETQKYVKLVYRNFIIYNRLISAKPISIHHKTFYH